MGLYKKGFQCIWHCIHHLLAYQNILIKCYTFYLILHFIDEKCHAQLVIDKSQLIFLYKYDESPNFGLDLSKVFHF